MRDLLASLLAYVKPKTRPIELPKDFSEVLATAIRSSGVLPPNAQVEVRRGIKPPPDPGADAPMTWPQWAKIMSDMSVDNEWTPCRFGTRCGDYNQMRFVFGITQRVFGIYRQPFTVCGNREKHGCEELLSALIWLPAGLGLGLFDTTATAVATAKLIGGQLESLESPDVSETAHAAWHAIMPRLRQEMAFNGIVPHPDHHAHDDVDGDPRPISIYIKSDEAILAGKPEKLA